MYTTQVGSVLVDPSKDKVIGRGYNRMPRRPGEQEEMDFPWSLEDPGVEHTETKYGYGK